MAKGIMAQSGGIGPMKVQRGATRVSATAGWVDITIEPVDITKAFVNITSLYTAGSNTIVTLVLVDSTTLKMTTGSTYLIAWEVVSF